MTCDETRDRFKHSASFYRKPTHPLYKPMNPKKTQPMENILPIDARACIYHKRHTENEPKGFGMIHHSYRVATG